MKSLAHKTMKIRRPMKIRGAKKKGQVFGRVMAQNSVENCTQHAVDPRILHVDAQAFHNLQHNSALLNEFAMKNEHNIAPNIYGQSREKGFIASSNMAMDTDYVNSYGNFDTSGTASQANSPNSMAYYGMGQYQNSFGISANYTNPAMTKHYGVTPFPGYPFLQYMSQNSLISAGVETTADEMTREFAKIVYNGEAKNEESDTHSGKKIQELEADIKRFGVRAAFCRAAEMIGYYGGCLIYIDNGESDPEMLKTPLYLDPTTFSKNSLQNFVVVDPINCTTGIYNATDPTKASYYVPETWIIMGKEVHKSRIMYFCGKEAPLLFKPAYNFFGVSSSQLALEYLENFTGNKESASRLLNNFSTTVLKTNMMGVLQGEGTSELQARLEIFMRERNNNGVFALDKEEEDLQKIDTSLSGVTDVVRQALELIAAVFRIPAVKFLGISPSGFNATGESDITNFYDFIASCQQKQLGQNLETVLKILQLNRYGLVDENLSMEWCALGNKEDKIKAETQKIKIDSLVALLDRNIIDSQECRKVLAEDKEGYLSFLV